MYCLHLQGSLEHKSPLFKKKGKLRIYQFSQEKREGRSVLHVTNVLSGRISHTDIGYSGRWRCFRCPYHRGPSYNEIGIRVSPAQHFLLQSCNSHLVLIIQLDDMFRLYKESSSRQLLKLRLNYYLCAIFCLGYTV
jgi:hypothetical protein